MHELRRRAPGRGGNVSRYWRPTPYSSSQPSFRACARGIVRAFAEWFRSLVLRSIQLARRLAAKRRIYIDIPEPQQFDDRILADIGITMDKGAKFDGQKHSSGNKPLHPQQVAVVATS